MRRAALPALIFAVLLIALLAILAVRALNTSPLASTAGTETAWAHILTDVYGPGGPTAVVTFQSPTPTPDATAVAETLEAYATAHQDAYGVLALADGPDGLRPRVSFTEEEINLLLEPYVKELPELIRVSVDFQPGADEGAPGVAAITAQARVLNLIEVTAYVDGQLEARHGRMHIEIGEASVGGIAPPQAAIDSVKGQIAPLINSAIYDGLSDYGDSDSISMTAIEIGDGVLTIEFSFDPPATLTPTPTG